MHRLLGQAAFVVFAPFRLTVVRLHSTLAWSLAKEVMQGYDSAFRVWRIFGGGKNRQTLCVLFLAKILNKKACPERSRRVLFILRRPKIFKRYLIFAQSSPPRLKRNREEKHSAGKPNLSRKRWLTSLAVTVGRLQLCFHI